MAFLTTAVLLAAATFSRAASSLIVNTTSGLVRGAVDPSTPHVAHYLGIPFAEAPVGDRRWAPGVRKARQGGVFDATSFGPACPQFEGEGKSVWSEDAVEFIITPRDYMSEDCLAVNVWAPWGGNATKEEEEDCKLLPVLAWIHGGSFQTGGPTVPYQDPSLWVEKSGRHIVVGINYRLNIFGFPNAAGLPLTEQNLGLLDQRLALEWIRDNIAAFGGDPARITLWGQSAGAVSVDNYHYAYPSDPIVSGLIMQSGTSYLDLTSRDAAHTNFTAVAAHFNCSSNSIVNNTSASGASELACLRRTPFRALLAHLKIHADTAAKPPLTFNPIIDSTTRFENYTSMTPSPSLPAIIGTTVDEGTVFLPYNATFGPADPATADAFTIAYFVCPAVQTTTDRLAVGAPTYRYLYGGNFSNIAPRWWQGAYHQADVPLVFGTHGIARGQSTLLEREVGDIMGDYWVRFAEDPVGGLEGVWDLYGGLGKEALLFGYQGEAVRGLAKGVLERACDGLIPNGKGKPPGF